ncbi:MAG: Tol-Pal system beta propeller repeat protein TolB [Pseudomonadota bacterium]
MKQAHPMIALVLLGLVTILAAPARAQQPDLVITIEDGIVGASPIAVVPFAWEATGVPPETPLEKVIANDLARTGLFSVLNDEDIIERPARVSDVRFPTWQRLGVDHIVIGAVTGNELDGFAVEVRLLNVATRESMLFLEFPSRAGELRYTAHHIADTVYEKITGVPGVFRTRIAYVTSAGTGEEQIFSLMVADADGHNPLPVVRSRQPLLSPSWSPDGERLAYVSFEEGNSSVWIQEIATGSRRKLASFRGINGAPSFSPDGDRLALTLSRTGNPEIYVMDLSSERFRQLTEHWAIDTEPRWTPDGRSVIFTSDRGGRPQLYQVPANGSEKPRRITREGQYNARATLSPDGERIGMVHGNDNDYRIAVLDKSNGVLQIVSGGPLDESPSFAPNGSMLLYASRRGSQGVLSAVPVLGVAAGVRASHQLIFAEGDIREPAWSPLRR